MAINIFSGTSSGAGTKAKVNSAAASTRAQQAKAALAAPAEASNSGNTAVKTSGTLAKVGNTVGKIAGLASKFLPGLGGTIAKGVASLFNDPEWWQHIPGDALTLNDPLTMAAPANYAYTEASRFGQIKAAFGEFTAVRDFSEDSIADYSVIRINNLMATQYLMPEIRKVVNAIPLQDADVYADVMMAQATLYAMWRNLKKFDYVLKHGSTFIPNLNDDAFPIFQVSNAAWLQTTINRLEEYLRANVRLPHTLCEYLAWRFGRVYRSNDSAKSAYIFYNVIQMNQGISFYEEVITRCMNFVTQSSDRQKANTDIYNAYYEHDLMVEIRDDTQCQYDTKEFMLRTNLVLVEDDTESNPVDIQPVVIDSRLDNPTTFMASCVSTPGLDATGQVSNLFPVAYARAYVYRDESYETPIAAGNNGWAALTIESYMLPFAPVAALMPGLVFNTLLLVTYCKSLDIYNKKIGFCVRVNPGTSTEEYIAMDATAISMDTGYVTDKALGTEHVYAFANLVDINRKTSMSYAKAEKLVAKEVANMVDTIDVATVAPSK